MVFLDNGSEPNVTEPLKAKLATRDSLPAEVVADLVALHQFLGARDRSARALFGPKLDRSHLRDELVRSVVIEFGFGRLRAIAHYQKACAHLGSPSSIRGELHLLSELGLVLYVPAENDRHTLQIAPSQKLIDWCSRQLPGLMADVERFIAARHVSR